MSDKTFQRSLKTLNQGQGQEHTGCVRAFAECDEVDDSVLHFEYRSALAVEHRDAVSAPRLVCWKASGEYHQALSGK